MPRHSRGGDYMPNWREIADKVKADAGWKCIRCGRAHSPETGYCLTVHHVDMDVSNNRWWNLLALCQRCHLEIQARVVLEQIYMFPHSEWLKPYVAGYYAWALGLPDDQEHVIGQEDLLIGLGMGL